MCSCVTSGVLALHVSQCCPDWHRNITTLPRKGQLTAVKMGHTLSITTWLHLGLILFIHGGLVSLFWGFLLICGIIPSCKEVEIFGVTFQCDSKFSVHVKNKLIKANKSLHILRTLRKEGYNQSEIDLLFNTIVLPNVNYALSVDAASESNLTPV